MPEIVAIAAVARNGVIGAGGAIPWHVPGDLPRFKRLTKGHVLIMGRKTYESIGRPLPGRSTIVITRNPAWGADGVEVVGSVDRAITRAQQIDPDGPVFIAGGGDIYRAALVRTDRLEITEVDLAPRGDATFPAIDADQWVQTGRDDDHDGFAWVSYTRRV
ncbi:dihydrofolate reductase [Microlunatus sp. Gsoil 973]|jgi:dihydrofolate reductase|uniref:dihydrofolate reductase n=1 Tax=Microlunatus sp. Gsoil 973 TaxID=2672569 RepID=UPI0012B4E460|nr:dihydrofolate reductase [Microlunatus sp. Gsoil 973]QGN31542.1 dihydrofolate reductase [Microlunatus sp. Gsoil 973]